MAHPEHTLSIPPPLGRNAVLLWAASVALGLGVAALGRLPAVFFSDLSGIHPPLMSAGLLPYVLTVGLAFAVAGGAVAALIQRQVLATQGVAVAHRWLLVTILGWAAGWALGLLPTSAMNHLTSVDPLTQAEIQLIPGLIGWMHVGIFSGFCQRMLMRRRLPLAWWWGLANAVAWILGALTCWAVYQLLAPWDSHLIGNLAPIAGGLVIGTATGLILQRRFAPAPASPPL
jgi:hypothetical protein